MRPAIMPRVVVLPHPFGPTRPATIPGSTVRESPLTTVLPPYRFVAPLTRRPLKGLPPSTAPRPACRRAGRGCVFTLPTPLLDAPDFEALEDAVLYAGVSTSPLALVRPVQHDRIGYETQYDDPDKVRLGLAL